MFPAPGETHWLMSDVALAVGTRRRHGQRCIRNEDLSGLKKEIKGGKKTRYETKCPPGIMLMASLRYAPVCDCSCTPVLSPLLRLYNDFSAARGSFDGAIPHEHQKALVAARALWRLASRRASKPSDTNEFQVQSTLLKFICRQTGLFFSDCSQHSKHLALIAKDSGKK